MGRLCGASLAFFGSLLLLLGSLVQADELPEQLRLVVPYTAGSSLDARARTIADAIGQRFERRITVENRPGAGGTLGMQYVAKSRPDGSTLLFHNNSYVITPQLYGKSGDAPLMNFVPVTQLYVSGLVLVVHPGLGVASVRDLVALARRQSKPLTYASSGSGGLPHLAMELFKRTAAIELLHVPYRGDGQALVDLLAGRVSLMMSGYPVAQPHIQAGALVALAVTSAERAEIFSAVPTIAQAGYADSTIDAWVGLFAPADTPGAVVDRLNREIAVAVDTPRVRTRLAATGAQVVMNSSAEFTAFVRKEWDRYGKLIRELKLNAE